MEAKGKGREKHRRATHGSDTEPECPLGIAALEDKIAQRTVVQVLTRNLRGRLPEILYGSVPDADSHDALDALQLGSP